MIHPYLIIAFLTLTKSKLLLLAKFLTSIHINNNAKDALEYQTLHYNDTQSLSPKYTMSYPDPLPSMNTLCTAEG